MFKTEGAAAFLAAWHELCKETVTPHYRIAFQHLSTAVIPHLMILEASSENKYVIRFMGTSRVEMWGSDLTGTDTLDLLPPPIASAARRNLKTMLDHPCGMHHVSTHITAAGREVETEIITVPVANDPGAPRRLLNFSEEISTLAYGEPCGQVRSIVVKEWLDIGGGVPPKPPAK